MSFLGDTIEYMFDRSAMVRDQGQLSLVEVATLINTLESVAVRLAVERTADGSRVLRMEVTGPVEVGDFDATTWDYGAFVFLSFVTAGDAVCAWINDHSVGINDLSAALAVGEQASWERLPSRADRDRPALPWPQVLQARFSPAGGMTQQPTSRPRLLVAPGAPTFPSYEVASEAFFHGLHSLSSPQAYGDALSIRILDRRARLTRLLFSSIGVDVHTDGSDVAGCRVELTSGTDHHEATVGAEGVAHLALPGGRPDEWWVVLSRGTDWLDYRYNTLYGRGPTPDVEIVADAVEPADELAALMSGGEGLTTEFKRQLPDNRDSRRKVARTVAAFANGIGGVILFGVDRDEFTLVGVDGQFPALRDQLNTFVTELLIPRPDVDIQPYQVEDKLVIGLHVKQGENLLYGIEPADPHYYIRRSGSTVPARPEDVASLIASRSLSTSASPWQGLPGLFQ